MFIDCQLPYSHSTDTDLWSLSWIHFFGMTMQTVYQKYQERGGRPVFKPDNFAGFQSLHQLLFDLAASDDYIRDMRINSGLNELLVFLMKRVVASGRVSGQGAEKAEPVANPELPGNALYGDDRAG